MTEPRSAETQPAEPHREVRLLPQPGYTPQIGVLVDMMAYARMTTLQAVKGMTLDELDTIPPGFTNSVGMLLAHIEATDRLYQAVSFEGRNPYPDDDFAPYVGAMTMGQSGERVTGRDLPTLLAGLQRTREATLAQLARRDDAWLGEIVQVPGWEDFQPNQHWAWFHVMEDEVSHRGQMRLIRKALKGP
jgi:uncharacterized damage-inducible protein DinB